MKYHEMYPNIKIWTKTHKKLKVLAALSMEPMTEVLDRIVRAECERLHIDTERLDAMVVSDD